jgi:phospholipid transport system substrate-binding protein
MMRIRALFLLISLGLLGAGLAGRAAAVETRAATSPEGAARFIGDIGNRAIAVIASEAVGSAEREAKVRALLAEGLDLDTIGRFVLGRSWQSASPAQRSEYMSLFRDYVLTTYTRRLGAYSGERFKVTGAEPIAGTDALVLTVIERPNAPPSPVNWRVRAADGKFKVIDVMVEGVSMALTQRQEFAAVLQNKGFDGLLAALRGQLQQLAAGGTQASSQ